MYIYIYTDNADERWGEGEREKRRNIMVKREKGKTEELFLRSTVTLHTAARAHTNVTKRFLGWTKPPYSSYMCNGYEQISLYIYVVNMYCMTRTCSHQLPKYPITNLVSILSSV